MNSKRYGLSCAKVRARPDQLLVVVLILGFGLGPSVAETEDEAPELPLSASGMGSVAEEELAPTLESNRQPLGPDPLVLPQWSAEERAAFEAGRPVNLGGGLWPAERYPLQPVPPWPVVPPETIAAAPGVLGWEMMSRYGAAREWCVDPQGAVAADRRARLEAHLAAHARSAVHSVRLWVLAPGQSVVDVLEEETMHRASFGLDQPGVLAVVSAAEPLAARVILPPALAARAPAWRATVISRLNPSAAPTNQLDQLALWLTLEAEPLPAIGTSVGLAGRSEMHAVADPARMDVVPAAGFRGGWWILGAAVVASVAVWRWRRRWRRQNRS